MRRFGRLLGAVCGVVVVVSGLAGCGPDQPPTVALQRDGDAVVLTAYLCPDDAVLELQVYDRDGGTAWVVVPPADPADGRPQGLVSYRLFVTPPGWSVEEADLTELAPGRRYAVATTMRGDPTVRFTVEDLDELGDRVLVSSDGDGESTAMGRAEFERKAADGCGG